MILEFCCSILYRYCKLGTLGSGNNIHFMIYLFTKITYKISINQVCIYSMARSCLPIQLCFLPTWKVRLNSLHKKLMKCYLNIVLYTRFLWFEINFMLIDTSMSIKYYLKAKEILNENLNC